MKYFISSYETHDPLTIEIRVVPKVLLDGRKINSSHSVMKKIRLRGFPQGKYLNSLVIEAQTIDDLENKIIEKIPELLTEDKQFYDLEILEKNGTFYIKFLKKRVFLATETYGRTYKRKYNLNLTFTNVLPENGIKIQARIKEIENGDLIEVYRGLRQLMSMTK
ncbi:MAG: hypothetical protein QW806_09110 [Nitrososphaerota archaeon]